MPGAVQPELHAPGMDTEPGPKTVKEVQPTSTPTSPPPDTVDLDVEEEPATEAEKVSGGSAPAPESPSAADASPPRPSGSAATPGDTVTGGPAEGTPGKGGLALLVVLEYGVYIIGAALLIAAFVINYALEHAWWGVTGDQLALSLFNADANFLLALGAILVIAFELRKERKGK